MLTLSLPQPFDEVDHTADLGVRVEGTSAEETLARLVLAHAQTLSGGGELAPTEEQPVEVSGAPDLAALAVDVLRAMQQGFDAGHTIVCEVTVVEISEHGARLRVRVGPYDPTAHREGIEIKAVTYHAARFEREGGRWVAQVVFDV